MQIEKLNKADIAGYKSLIDSCFGGSNSMDTYENSYSEDSDKYAVMVAKDGDKIVGSLTIYQMDLFTYDFQPALEIFNVCILPEYRGQKVAKQLFEYVFDYANKNNYKSVNLTCLDSATAAHRLYESVGMKRAGSVKYSITL